MEGITKVVAGRTLGRYQLLAAAGQGGMAEVYRARDTQLDRLVAVKVVLPHLAGQEELTRRFLREARLAAHLEHPNVLPVYDFGEQEGVPFLVMPWVEAGSLEERMAGQPIERERALAWVTELASALDHAHREGVLHRDVKPSNVLLDRHDRALLADFGIAFAAGAATRLTRAGSVLGTPEYMAPELVEGEPASAASDLYALAVLAWELFAGRPPFSAESALSVLHQHAHKPVPRLSDLVPGLPAAVDPVFLRALAKLPADRPTSCGAFARELAAAAPTTGAATRPASATAPTRIDATRGTPAAEVRGPEAPGRMARGSSGMTVIQPPSKGRWAAALTVAALAGVALGTWLWRGSGELAPPTQGEQQREAVSETAKSGHAEPAAAPGLADSAPAGTDSSPAPARPTLTEPEPQAKPPAVGAVSTEPPQEPQQRPEPEPEGQTEGAAPAGPSPATEERRAGGLLPGRRRGLGNPASERREGPLRAETARLAELVLGPRPFTPATFDLLTREAERMAGTRGGEVNARGLALYAEGGRAYLAGDDATARARLVALASTSLPPLLTGAGPLWVLRDRGGAPLADWELAVAYGDARGEGRRLVGDPTPSAELRRRFAHAFLARLHGDHQAAIATAGELYRTARPESPERAADLARFLAAEHVALGQHQEALEWFDRAIEGATGKLLGAAALEAARIAEEKLSDPAAARRYLEIACRAGTPLACRRLDSLR